MSQLFPGVTDYDQVPPEVWRYCQANWESGPIDKFNDARRRVGIDVPDLLPDSYKVQTTQLYQALDSLSPQLRAVVDFDRFFKFGLLSIYSKSNPEFLQADRWANILSSLSKLQDVLTKDTIVSRRRGIITYVSLSFNPPAALITTDLADVTAEDLLMSDFVYFNRLSLPDWFSLPKNYGFVAHRDELASLYYLSAYIVLMASEREQL